jgi:hypothetical protein
VIVFFEFYGTRTVKIRYAYYAVLRYAYRYFLYFLIIYGTRTVKLLLRYAYRILTVRVPVRVDPGGVHFNKVPFFLPLFLFSAVLLFYTPNPCLGLIAC